MSLAAAAAIIFVIAPCAAIYPPAARRLARGRGFVWSLATAFIVALIAASLAAAGVIERRLAVMLSAPLLQLPILSGAFRTFVRTQGREPVDVAFNWSPGLQADRLFAIGVSLACILPFLYLAG